MLIANKYLYLTFVKPSSLTIMQKPLGLLSLLDEESTFPNGTDLTFASKLEQHLRADPCFRAEREKAFTVCHYAGEVCIISLIPFSLSLLLLNLSCYLIIACQIYRYKKYFWYCTIVKHQCLIRIV